MRLLFSLRCAFPAACRCTGGNAWDWKVRNDSKCPLTLTIPHYIHPSISSQLSIQQRLFVKIADAAFCFSTSESKSKRLQSLAQEHGCGSCRANEESSCGCTRLDQGSPLKTNGRWRQQPYLLPRAISTSRRSHCTYTLVSTSRSRFAMMKHSRLPPILLSDVLAAEIAEAANALLDLCGRQTCTNGKSISFVQRLQILDEAKTKAFRALNQNAQRKVET